MEIKRRRFQGVLHILSFNRHFYYFGLIMMIGLGSSPFFIDWNSVLFYSILFALLYGLLMPLIISAYVYDFSGYHQLDWLEKLFHKPSTKGEFINIHSGFDETSFTLKRYFTEAHLHVFDFYNPTFHTEKAIKRARKVSVFYPNTVPISTNHIPLEANRVDTIFLLSAIHEIRSDQEKIIYLKECRRVCKPDGKLIIVEHLRDLPNFLAFTVGFTHFFSRKTWINCLNSAGFTSVTENKFTPFMSIFQASV